MRRKLSIGHKGEDEGLVDDNHRCADLDADVHLNHIVVQHAGGPGILHSAGGEVVSNRPQPQLDGTARSYSQPGCRHAQWR